jgi:hypothetical protein
MSINGSATRRELRAGGRVFEYYSLAAAQELGLADVSRLPCSLKVVLENVLRQHAEGRADGADIAAVAGWLARRRAEREIAFRFTRVLMPDSSGVPLLGDLAAMRDAMIRLCGDPTRLNPSVPVDLIVDHSVTVDAYGVPDAASRNQALELQRNAERYAFLRWGAQAFDHLRIVPPGNGICHQVNLEYLARVVWTSDREGPEGTRPIAYPDSVLGMDSHTAMINSLGILGWGVGGLEGGAGALGESVAMLVPEVIGCRQLRGLQSHRGAVRVQVTHKRRQQDRFTDVGHVDAQAAGGTARVEGLAAAHGAAHHGQRFGERRRQFQRARRRQHAGARVDEQGIAELLAQAPQRAAHRRLREADLCRGTRYAAVAEHRLEHQQQIQVGRAVQRSISI